MLSHMKSHEIAATAIGAAGAYDLAKGRGAIGYLAVAGAAAVYLLGEHAARKRCLEQQRAYHGARGVASDDIERFAQQDCR
jgi:hypothetical protein